MVLDPFYQTTEKGLVAYGKANELLGGGDQFVESFMSCRMTSGFGDGGGGFQISKWEAKREPRGRMEIEDKCFKIEDVGAAHSIMDWKTT